MTDTAIEISDKHSRFINEYLIDCNGKQAAIRAGYSEGCAAQTASEILTYPNVRKVLEQRKAELIKEIREDQLNTLRKTLNIVNFDVRKLFDADGNLKPIQELDDETALALNSIEVGEMKKAGEDAIYRVVKFKASDRLKAIEMLGKYQNLKLNGNGDDKKEIDVNINVNISAEERNDSTSKRLSELWQVQPTNN
jgi:phage terminase small subunit